MIMARYLDETAASTGGCHGDDVAAAIAGSRLVASGRRLLMLGRPHFAVTAYLSLESF